jgi:hypothetical protein
MTSGTLVAADLFEAAGAAGPGLAGAALKVRPVLAAGWLLDRLLRRSSPSARHAAWLAAVVGALAVPTLSAALPA